MLCNFFIGIWNMMYWVKGFVVKWQLGNVLMSYEERGSVL